MTKKRRVNHICNA